MPNTKGDSMAEFKTVMGEFQRLCSERKCGSCPVGNEVFNERASYCCVWVKNHPEEAERIIMQWAAKHPIVTNRDKFIEVFGLDYFDPLPGGVSAWLMAEYKGGQDEQD